MINALEVFIKEVERQVDRKVKIARSDRGGEYFARYDENGQHPDSFSKFHTMHSIYTEYIMPETPQQNGVAERGNRTLLDMVRSMLSNSFVPLSLWVYALRNVVFLLNRVHSKAVPKTACLGLLGRS